MSQGEFVIRTQDDEEVKITKAHYESNKMNGVSIAVISSVVIWVVAGALAFVTSIGCWAYVSDREKLLTNLGMFLAAIFLGPLYWIVFPFTKYGLRYCTKPKSK